MAYINGNDDFLIALKGDKGDKGDKGEPTEVLQTKGQSTTAVMSQKAVTDEIDTIKDDLDDLRTKKISLNIFDRNECTSGYMDTRGVVYTSQTLVYTPKITVETGDVIRAYKNSSNGLVPTNMKFITAFLSTTGNANTYYGGTNVSEFTIVDSTNKIVITADENVDEITINHQPTSYEPKHDPYSVIKESALPRASETVFGVAKMWVTVDEDGNKVLNISTGDENE